MKIAVLGGTGDLGRGLVTRWAKFHEVIVGSRSEEKGRSLADEYRAIAEKHFGAELKGSIQGTENTKAAKASDVVVFTIPQEYLLEFLPTVKPFIDRQKILISPVVPMRRVDKYFIYTPYLIGEPPRPLSAGEAISSILETDRVVSAFHSIPARKLAQLELTLDYDVPLAGDDKDAVQVVSDLIKQIPNLKPLYAGPLSTSSLLESITPFLLNLSIYNKIKDPSIRVG
ncbi:MAG: NADPH-dependent F420 reductase [Nitrososphaerales archaeon]|nr:NADPH-dependent F420 reductase [Nitrososphaerales archaeon]